MNNDMRAELLPCPFCRGKDIRFDRHIDHRSSTGVVYSMCCYDCGATFPNRASKEPMVAAWNTRAALSLSSKVEPAPSNMNMRAAFEALRNGFDLSKHENGEYKNNKTKRYWDDHEVIWNMALQASASPALNVTPEDRRMEHIRIAAEGALQSSDMRHILSSLSTIADLSVGLGVPTPTQEQMVEEQQPVAYLVNYYELTKGGSKMNCTQASLEPHMPPIICGDTPEIVERILISSTPLYDHPSQATNLFSNEEKEFAASALGLTSKPEPVSLKRVIEVADKLECYEATAAERSGKFYETFTFDETTIMEFLRTFTAPQPAITRERIIEIYNEADEQFLTYDDNEFSEIFANRLLDELNQPGAGDFTGSRG